MNDIKISPQAGDIYFAIDRENKALDICKSTAGEAGFREFMDNNVKRVMNKNRTPSVWMLHYRVEDMECLPVVSPQSNPNF